MLIDINIFFLGLALIFYVLFGGADFGAGIVETFSGKQNREAIAHAIGPVWEANHVWLVLVVVILFMGFPKIYSMMSLYLHLPLLLMLIGIVLRGTAFTYMHYDAIKDRSNNVYNAIFKISSVLTPFFLGIITGAMVLGKVNPNAGSFYEGFIAPWLNLFSITVGIFTIAIFGFLAAVYLIGESDDQELKEAFMKAAQRINGLVVVSGALVFLTAYWNDLPLLQRFLDSWVAMGLVLLATVILPITWQSLSKGAVIASRIYAGAQVLLIMLAWFWVQYPVVLNLTDPATDLTFHNSAAPEATLLQLTLALIVGSLIILPSLYFLMKTFKGEQFANKKH
ncbi:MAG: cytochrome d ubiquinol oxidase subunit II [Bacteroidota bacterium]